MLLGWLAACLPSDFGAPAPSVPAARPVAVVTAASPPPFDHCPAIDFVRALPPATDTTFSFVRALPEGGVVVAGLHVGAEAFGDTGDRLPARALGPRQDPDAPSTFVARVSPDGRLQWTHELRNSLPDELTVVGDRVWLSGTVSGSLWVDQDRLGRAPGPGRAAFAVQLDAAGGVVRHLVVGQEVERAFVTADAAGNAYLTGRHVAARFHVGALALPHPNLSGSELFAASFGPAGELRWLSGAGSPDHDDASAARWSGDHLVWPVDFGGRPWAIGDSGGGGGPLAGQPPDGPDSATSALLSVDPATGALALATQGPAPWLWEVSPAPFQVAGGRAIGREVPRGLHPDHEFITSVAPRPDGHATAVLLSPSGLPFGEGTPLASTLPGDPALVLLDADAGFRCAWQWSQFDHTTPFGLAWDAAGGLWLMANPDGRFEVTDPRGHVLVTGGTDDPLASTAVLLRLKPPGTAPTP